MCWRMIALYTSTHTLCKICYSFLNYSIMFSTLLLPLWHSSVGDCAPELGGFP